MPRKVKPHRSEPGLSLHAQGDKLLAEGTWHGWCWLSRQRRWVRVCVADSMGAAAALLSRKADRLQVQDASTCLTRGGAPSWIPAMVTAHKSRVSNV
jgi:hypothetical protein